MIIVTINDIIKERIEALSPITIDMIPVNIVTRREYSGINVLLLSGNPVYGTYRQMTGLGCKLKEMDERGDRIAIGYMNGRKHYYRLYSCDDVILSEIARESMEKIKENSKRLSEEESDKLIERLMVENRLKRD